MNKLLICNGEIYNFKKFYENHPDIVPKTHSDCEVIIYMYEKYGIETTCSMIDGVFAFVLVDFSVKPFKMFAARDPYGVRPLYTFHFQSLYNEFNIDTFGFSSEMKMVSNDDYLKIENIKQFQPGTINKYIYKNINDVDINLKDILNEKYICNYESSFTYFTHYGVIDYHFNNDTFQCIQLIKKTLEDAVKKRVDNTDRPIACLLSGGLDSSLITSLVNKYYSNNERKLETFSIGMKGSEDLKYAKIVADYLDTNHTQIELSEKEFLDAIPEVIKAIESYDTTTVRASVGNYLVCKYISKHSDAKVIFNGDGSDEVTGGYMYFHYAPNSESFDFECKRLLKDIHLYDVLRSDRTISSNGLEARTPFLDRTFIQNYLSIDKNLRFHTNKNKCEKYLLRSAFDDGETLPYEVLWRTKEAFSDGVSSQKKSWYQIIQDYLSNNKENIQINDYDDYDKYIINYPDTLEKKYYRTLFDTYYSNAHNVIPYFWMPKFIEANDASARTLHIYNSKIVNNNK
jgi:asparagine synthase (glutamine-hydrolysing)